MADYFRTFPSYTGFDFMTYESSYKEQFGFATVEQASEYANNELDYEDMLVWFRDKEPIAFMSRGDISWVGLKKGVNLTKVLGLKRAPEFRSGTLCVIYPIELLDLALHELENHKHIKQVMFNDRLNMLKFKGLFAAEIATNSSVFMLCAKVEKNCDPVELDRLTWESTTFGKNQVVLYNTTKLWQIVMLKDPDQFGINLEPGACISKGTASLLFDSAQFARYYQTEPSIAVIANAKNKAPDSKLLLLYRKTNRVNFVVLEPNSIDL